MGLVAGDADKDGIFLKSGNVKVLETTHTALKALPVEETDDVLRDNLNFSEKKLNEKHTKLQAIPGKVPGAWLRFGRQIRVDGTGGPVCSTHVGFSK